MNTPLSKSLNSPASVAAEFQGAELNDPRRSRRLHEVAIAAAAQPSASFPQQGGSEAGVEGTYRFLSNESINPRDVLAPHIQRAVDRANDLGTVLAVQDTTKFSFKGESPREGLGRLLKKGQGFFGHFCIGVGPNGRPLGTLGLETTVRGSERRGRKSPAQLRNDPNNEQLRWARMARQVEQRLNSEVHVVHVMDREADDYAMYADILARGQSFVVRIFRDRNLSAPSADASTSAPAKGPARKLFETMVQLPVLGQRTIELSARPAKGPKSTQKIHPPRKARSATVHLCAGTVEIKRSGACDPALPTSLQLNVVQVYEPHPPAGQPAVLWRLITPEPVTSIEEVERVVDMYRQRWVIEEFFKAIKTGCAYERRQLQSYHGLLNALAIFTAVAWRMLLLRFLDRMTPEASADIALTPSQVQTLQVVAPKYRLNLPDKLTAHDATVAIARLGGHLRRNGPPGWLTIGRGFDRLLTMEQAYLAMREALDGQTSALPKMETEGAPTCDQS